MGTIQKTLITLLGLVVTVSGASAATFNVSNPAEFQTALTTAQANGDSDVINVAAGTYPITATLTYTAAASENFQLSILGFDSTLVILAGNLQVPILRIDTTAVTADDNIAITVTNMTFEDGNAVGTPSDGGALAILVDDTAQPPFAVSVAVTGSEFYDNFADDDGGAIFVRGNIDEGIILDDLTIDANVARGIAGDGTGDGGGAYIAGGFGTTVVLNNIDFFDNMAQGNGGGVEVEGLLDGDPVSLVSLFDIDFDTNQSTGTGNGGGASILASDLSVEIVGFLDNTATLGGGLHLRVNTGLIMKNSGFNGNIATNGGGLGTDPAADSRVALTNNTFSGNTATNQGGGALVSRGGSTLIVYFYNNILWANAGASGADLFVNDDPFGLGGIDVATIELFNNDFSDFNTTCTLDAGCTPSITQNGNIDADPLLGPFGRLTTGSPAIDTGDNNGASCFGCGPPPTDFEGDPRPFDGNGDTVAIIDIGADEFTGQPAQNADLSVTKTDTPDPVTGGGNVTYTVTVTNNGPGGATNVALLDTLDSLVSFVSVNQTQGTCTPTSGLVSCNLGSIANGGTATVTIVVTTPDVAVATPITNQAVVSAAEPDPNAANDSATEQTTVVAAGPATADLALTKSDTPDPVFSGGQDITYTLTATNNGPDGATGVMLTDTLPVGVTFVSADSADGTCSEISGIVTCDFGALALNASAVATIVMTPDVVTDPTDITNTATVAATELDPVPANNAATETTTVNPPSADMNVGISSTPTSPSINEQITYAIAVANGGPSNNTGVGLTITLPMAAAYGSVTIDQGSCDDSTATSGTIVCTIGDQASGATVMAQVVMTAPGQATVLTLAAAVSGDVADPTPGNDSGSQEVSVIDAIDLIIEGVGGSGSLGWLELLLASAGVLGLSIRHRRAAYTTYALLPLLFGGTALLVLAPGDEARAEPDWYLGASIGQSDANYSAGDLQTDLAALGWSINNPSTNDTDTAWKVYGGFAFNDFFALEAGYVELGEVNTRFGATIPPTDVDALLNDTLSVHPYLGNGWVAAGVLSWPISPDRFSLTARAGLFAWKADIDVRVVSGGTGNVSGDESGTDGMYGVGVEWRINPTWSITADWERYQLNDWVDLPSVGLRFRFP